MPILASNKLDQHVIALPHCVKVYAKQSIAGSLEKSWYTSYDMSDNQRSIATAVQVALAPTSSQQQRSEAYGFLEQVKTKAAETWRDCFLLFLANNQYGPDARLFALQVLDEAIGNGSARAC